MSDLDPIREKTKLRVRTVIVSDVHLGMKDSKALQAAHFLRHTVCVKLILNGDIIDAWHLQRLGGWNHGHTSFIRTVLRKMEKENTQVIYLRGNHDDILDRFIPIQLDNLSIAEEHVHATSRGDYLIVHGDGFDAVTTNHAWLAKLGGYGYNALLRFNGIIYWVRKLFGKDPFSHAKWAKAKVKSKVSPMGRWEEQVVELARWRQCAGLICGHIHTPTDKMLGEIHYLNSGDWVESMTAIVENLDGSFQIIGYPEFCQRTHRDPKGAASDPDDGAEDAPQSASSAIPM